jgi:glycosyltransferase involved in cell wall biosynthesis
MSALEHLVTDVWVPPSSLLAKLGGSKLGERFHSELREAPVTGFNASLFWFEIVARTRGLKGWEKIIRRNDWFQRKVGSYLRSQFSTINYRPTLLSYSYTALEPFRHAKSRGWKTVLMQIDPGPEEERIVAQEAARVPELAAGWQPAPAEYWDLWREECKLADGIVVNSEWSREGLIRRGVASEKITVIPLAYEATDVRDQKSEVRFTRSYPDRFTQKRPLRVLFLGLINLRKGIAPLLEAAAMLRDQPVEFWFVGPVEIGNGNTTGNTAPLKWFGPTTRQESAEFYKNADVFILPTLSDGFAITQLEAQAHGLPVIASKFCGDVVKDGFNGMVLEEPTAACIAATIRDCLGDPSRLQKLASVLTVRERFTIEALGQQLQHLGAAV